MRSCLMLRLVGSMISGLEMEQTAILVLFAARSFRSGLDRGWPIIVVEVAY